MERSLIERSIALHGSALGKLVAEEQGEEDLETDAAEHTAPELASKNQPPQKQSHLSDKKSSVKRPTFQMGTSQPESYKIQQFIAKKADMLFKKRGDPAKGTGTQIVMQPSEQADYYAILPPLEQHMAVPPDASRARLFQLLHVGDVVVGRIVSSKEFGLFVQLVSLCQDLTRYVEMSEVIALLPATELSDRFSKAVKVDDFQVGEYIRGVVTKVNVDEQKVIMTLKAPPNMDQAIILGMISESELPIHYRRSLALADSLESHEQMLTNTLGFDNPNNVAYLTNLLGIDEKKPPSLMRSLQSVHFTESESAESLRKWQSGKLAMSSVAKGVDHFKAGRHLEAMQHLNKALEIDTENVEALVARGALYANTGSLSKALQDFGTALQINTNHRNANKYMCQTLLERGKELEESKKYMKARECYQSALDIQPEWLDAQLCLQKLNERKPPVQSQTPSKFSASAPSQMSAEALLKMVDQDDSQSDKDESKKSNKRRKSHEKKETYTVRSRWCSSSRSRSRERSQEPNTSPLREQISKRQDNVIEEKGKDGKRRLSKELDNDNQQKSMTSRESTSEIKGKNRSPNLARSPDRNKPGKSKINSQERSKSQKRKPESRWSKSGSRTPSPSRSANKQKLKKTSLDSKAKSRSPERQFAKSRSPERQSKSRRNKSESRTRSSSRSPGERSSRKSRRDSHERSRSLKRQSKSRRNKSESRTPSPSRSTDERNSRKSRRDSHERSRSLKSQSESRRNKSESRTRSPSRSPGGRISRKTRRGSHERSRSLKRQSESRRKKSESRTPSPSRSANRKKLKSRDSKDRSRSPKIKSKRKKSESKTPSPTRSPGVQNSSKMILDSHEISQLLEKKSERKRNKSERIRSSSRSPGGRNSRKTRLDSHNRSPSLKRQSESRRSKSESRTPSPSSCSDRKNLRKTSLDSHDMLPSPKRKSERRRKKSGSRTPSPQRSTDGKKIRKTSRNSCDKLQSPKRMYDRSNRSGSKSPSRSVSPGERKLIKTRLGSSQRSQSPKIKSISRRDKSGSRTPSPSRSTDKKKLRKTSLDMRDNSGSPKRRSKSRRDKSGSRTPSPSRSTDKNKLRKTSLDMRDKSGSPKRRSKSRRDKSGSRTPSPTRSTVKKKLRKTSLDMLDNSGSPKRISKSRRNKSGSNSPSPSRSTDNTKPGQSHLDSINYSESLKNKSESRILSFDKDIAEQKADKRTLKTTGSESEEIADKKDILKKRSESKSVSKRNRHDSTTSDFDLENSSKLMKRKSSSGRYQSRSRSRSPFDKTSVKKTDKMAKPNQTSDSDSVSKSVSKRNRHDSTALDFDLENSSKLMKRKSSSGRYQSRSRSRSPFDKTSVKKTDKMAKPNQTSDSDSVSKSVSKRNRHDSTALDFDLENSSKLMKRKSSSGRYQSRSRSRSPFDKTSVKKTDKMAKPNQTSDSDSDHQVRPLKRDKGKSRKQSGEKESVLVQMKDKCAQVNNDVHTRAESPVRKSEISKIKKKQNPSKSSRIEKSEKKTDVELTTYQKSNSESCDRQDRSSKPEVKEVMNFSEDQTKKQDKKITGNIQSQNDATRKRSHSGKSVNELSTKKRLFKLSSSPSNDADQQLEMNKTSSERMAHSRSCSRSPPKKYSKKKKKMVSSTSSSSSESEDISPPSKNKSIKKKKKKQSSSSSSSDSDSEKPKLKSAKKIKKRKKSENKSKLSDVKKKISTDESEGVVGGKLNPESKDNLKKKISHSVLNKQNANSIVSCYSSHADASDISMAYSRPSCRSSVEDQQFASKTGADISSLSRKQKQFQEDRSGSHSPSQDLANDQKVVAKCSTDSSFADKPERPKTYSQSSGRESDERQHREHSQGENSKQLKSPSKSSNAGRPVTSNTSLRISESPHIHDEYPTTETEMSKDSEGSVTESSGKEQSVGKVLELSKEQQAMLRQKYRNFNKVKQKSGANVENLQNPTGPKRPPSPDYRQPRARTPDPADVYGISASASFMYEDSHMPPSNKVGLASSYEGFMDKHEKAVDLIGKDSVNKLYEKQEVIKPEDTVVPVTKVSKPSRWDRKESAKAPFDVIDKSIPSKTENRGVRWGGYKNRDVYTTQSAHTSIVNDHVKQGEMCKDEDTWGTRRTSSRGSSYICGEDELRKAQDSFNKERDSTEKQWHRTEEHHMAYGADVSRQLDYGKDKSMADETSNKFHKYIFSKEKSNRTKRFQEEESYAHVRKSAETYVSSMGDNIRDKYTVPEDKQFSERHFSESTSYGLDQTSSEAHRHSGSLTNEERSDEKKHHFVEDRPRSRGDSDRNSRRNYKKCDDGIHCGTDDEDEILSKNCRLTKNGMSSEKKCDDGDQAPVSKSRQKKYHRDSKDKDDYKTKKKCDDGIHCGTDDEDQVPILRNRQRKDKSQLNRQSQGGTTYNKFDDSIHCGTDEDLKLDNQARQAGGTHGKKYAKKCDDGIHIGTDDEDNKVPLNSHCSDKGHSEKRINNEDSTTEKRCVDGVHCGTDDDENVSHNQEKDQLGRKMKKQQKKLGKKYDSATGERDVSTQRTRKLLKNQGVAMKNDGTKIACEDGIHCGTEDDEDDESIRTIMLDKKHLINDDCKKTREVDLKNRDRGKCPDGVHCGTDDEMDPIPQSDLDDKTKTTLPIVHQRLLHSNKNPNSQVEINAQRYASSTTNNHKDPRSKKEGARYQHNRKPKDHVRSNSESSSSDSSRSRSKSYSSTSSNSSSVNSDSSSGSSSGSSRSGSSSSSSSNSSQQSRGNKRRRKQQKSYSSSTDTSTSSSSISQRESEKPSHIKKKQRKKRRKRNSSVTSSSTLSSTNSSTSGSKFKHSDHNNKYSDKNRSGKHKRYSSSSSTSNDVSSKKKSANKDSSSDSSGEVDMSIYEIKTDSLENYLETVGHKLVSPPENNNQWKKRKTSRSSENDTSDEENARRSIKDKESRSEKTKEDRKRRTKGQMPSSRSPSPSDRGRTTKILEKKVTDTEWHIGDVSERTPLREDDIYSHRDRNTDSYVDEQREGTQDHISNDRYGDRYPRGSNDDSTIDRYRDKNSSRYRPDKNASDKQRDRNADVQLRDRSYDRSQDNYKHEHRNSQSRDNSRHGHRHREGRHKRPKYIPVEIKESNPFFSLLTRDKAALLKDLYKEVAGEIETNEESGVKTNHGGHRVWWTSESWNDGAE